MRKFAELPFHLIGSNRVQDLCDNVLFNYHWLHSKISAVPIMNILEDFSHALTVIKDPILRRQVRETLKFIYSEKATNFCKISIVDGQIYGGHFTKFLWHSQNI